MLKVAIVGCGYMGVMHINCYKNMQNVQIVAVSGVCSDAAKQAVEGLDARIFEDAKEMLETVEVDIIDICLPTFLHAEYGLLAMDKARYVFIEKPVTLTVEEGEALIAKEKETGCRVQVGQVIRFWDEYAELKRIVRSEKYGKVVNANFRRISPRPAWGFNNWLTNPALSGGGGQDLHIHDVDYILSLFGEPNTFYTVRNEIGEANSYINTLMQYDDFVVSAEGTWDLPAAYPFAATFRVVFENAAVEYTGGKLTVYDADGAHDVDLEKRHVSGQVYASGKASGNITELGGYFNELSYFCERAEKNEPIEEAKLSEAVASLVFLKKELAFCENN